MAEGNFEGNLVVRKAVADFDLEGKPDLVYNPGFHNLEEFRKAAEAVAGYYYY